MAKHRAAWNCRRYHKLVNEGCGLGIGSDYKPWITIHDPASKGIVSRVLGRTTGRIHHLLSKNETAFFYILDASEKAIDIREQFPLLPVTETAEIAERLGIRHPRDPVSKYPYVMTTDFVITTQQGNVARSVKLSSELKKTRVQEKLEIERAYWEKRDIEWRIVTEKEIDYQKSRNLEWVYLGLSRDIAWLLKNGDSIPDGEWMARNYPQTTGRSINTYLLHNISGSSSRGNRFEDYLANRIMKDIGKDSIDAPVSRQIGSILSIEKAFGSMEKFCER